MAHLVHHGFVVLDKPAGITSRAALDRAQRCFPAGTRLGHTGTLDPLATGVLVVAVGVATRLTEYVQRMAKTYCAGVMLGARSDSDDADGRITPVTAARVPSPAELAETLRGFIGAHDQVPPAFSAAHVAGRRAYELSRRGQHVELAPRRVAIHAIDVERYEYPMLQLRIECGKGTYIRSLARDLGERLGCGGYIASLRRTRVGCFHESQARSLDSDGAIDLLPLAQAVVDLRRMEVDAAAVAELRHGRPLRIDSSALQSGQEVALLDERGELVAIASVAEDQRCLRPEKVMPFSSGPRG